VLLTGEADGCTYLSPAGEAFVRAYRFALERSAHVPVYLSAVARKAYEQAEASVRALWDRTLKKLRSPELRRTTSDRVGDCDCLVFPKGHRAERAFWFEDDGTVYVCELARHSDESYERLIARGVYRKDYPQRSFNLLEPYAWAPLPVALARARRNNR
jgi:hypothetical protein